MPPAWKIPLVGNTIGHLVQVSFSKHIKHHFGAKYSGGEMPVTFPEGFYHRLNSLFLFCCSARHSCPQGHNLCCLGSFLKLTGGRSVELIHNGCSNFLMKGSVLLDRKSTRLNSSH